MAKRVGPAAAEIAARLARIFPAVECALVHRSPLELLVATILSAQCTDERVNQVTPVLFARYPSAEKLAGARIEDLESIIKSTGFFRNKAKNIQGCCAALVERHGGEVPRRLEELVRLPGVGRKTANVVLGTAFGIASGVVVDTHVGRLSKRLGLTRASDPVRIEQDLMERLPAEAWIAFSHRMIWHGRRTCQARKPRCEACELAEVCPKTGVKTLRTQSTTKRAATKRSATKQAEAGRGAVRATTRKPKRKDRA
jgi:endonuclease-3